MIDDMANSQDITTLANTLKAIGVPVPAELKEILDRGAWKVDLPPAPDISKVSTAKTEKDYATAYLAYARAKVDYAAAIAVKDELAPIRATQTKTALASAKATALPAVIERFNTVAGQFTEVAQDLPSLSLASMSAKDAENFIKVRSTSDDLRTIHSAYTTIVGNLTGDLYWHSFVEIQTKDQFKDILQVNKSTEMEPLAPYYAPVVNGGTLRLLSKADAQKAMSEFNANRDPEPAEVHPHSVGLDPKVGRMLQSQGRG